MAAPAPQPVAFAIRGPITRADLPGLCERVCALLERNDADDIVCDAPAGRIEGAEGAELIAAFGDEETALVMYDTDTVPVKGAPGAECVAVKDGRIVRSRFVFDREPFLAPAR